MSLRQKHKEKFITEGEINMEIGESIELSNLLETKRELFELIMRGEII